MAHNLNSKQYWDAPWLIDKSKSRTVPPFDEDQSTEFNGFEEWSGSK